MSESAIGQMWWHYNGCVAKVVTHVYGDKWLVRVWDTEKEKLIDMYELVSLDTLSKGVLGMTVEDVYFTCGECESW